MALCISAYGVLSHGFFDSGFFAGVPKFPLSIKKKTKLNSWYRVHESCEIIYSQKISKNATIIKEKNIYIQVKYVENPGNLQCFQKNGVFQSCKWTTINEKSIFPGNNGEFLWNRFGHTGRYKTSRYRLEVIDRFLKMRRI